MKQIICFLSAFALMLMLCGCGAKREDETAVDSSPVSPVIESAEPAVFSDPSQDILSDGEDTGLTSAFTFTTTDRDGNRADETIFSGHRLTLLNFWEPWCGPCVQEMPELQKLYEDYSENGLLIIGIYSTPGMEEDVTDVLASADTAYPILHYTADFDGFRTGYVPTSVFIDGEGKPVGEIIIGARGYSEWEALVLEYMP